MSDFTNITDIHIDFTETELDSGVDFFSTDDMGTVIIAGSGWGDDWGDIPWGGEDVVIPVLAPTTQWTNIDEP